MANLLTMPSLSPTMETGVISSWNKKVGDYLEVGDVLAEIETDKAVMEFELADEGYLRELLVEPGKEIAVGTPIAIVADSTDEDISDVLQQVKSGATPAARPEEKEAGTETPAPQEAEAAPPPQTAAEPAAGNGATRAEGERVRISPYARKLAEERGLDYAALEGSGPGGRIVARDVESAGASSAARPASTAAPATGMPESGVAYEDLPVSQMRKAIARRMTESKTSVPHFQLTRKVRAERLLAAREQLLASAPDVKISLNDIIVKACAAALRRHPNVNSQFLGDKVRRFHTVDISVAVATEEGLITPVLRNADRKGLAQIATEVRELATKARDKKLAPEEYEGGTFTVSNLGMFNVTEFNAIINTPQACILAVSSAVEEPVVENGALAVGQTMNMTLSSDHRVVDGAMAARFMETLAAMIENPLAILL